MEEEMDLPQVIVEGKVVEELPVFVQDAGLDSRINFEFPVTPSKVKVTKVIAGNISTDEEITFYQLGDRNTQKDGFVKPGEEVMLLLQKKPEGNYKLFLGDALGPSVYGGPRSYRCCL
ncbi:hypothetical protein AB432_015735 [Brevibacillus brevis]|uniref:Uncharacterized protein n=1 Tax=Brevibacillus brevis TaxID=1393 RepID=A0A2Z4MIP2_BREBE|nr:hypothetical protein [Brevibacillus brevis]AWX56397.1 hypothetical protein AB432_015735 [Brevibacillus brevis]